MSIIKIEKENGHTVPCVTVIPPDPEGIVIAVHGFSSSKECPTYLMLERRLPAAGLGMIGIDLPGHGVDEALAETLRIQAAIDSIAAAEKYAVEQYPNLPVYYFASSFGAYLTGLYISTREHKGRKAFFRSAAVNMPSLFLKDTLTEEEKQNMKDLEERGYFDTAMDQHRPVRITKEMYEDLKETDLFEIFNPDRFGATQVAMVHGEKDVVIDPDAAMRFAKQFHLQATFLPGEGHSLAEDPATPDRVADLAIAFYKG